MPQTVQHNQNVQVKLVNLNKKQPKTNKNSNKIRNTRSIIQNYTADLKKKEETN